MSLRARPNSPSRLRAVHQSQDLPAPLLNPSVCEEHRVDDMVLLIVPRISLDLFVRRYEHNV